MKKKIVIPLVCSLFISNIAIAGMNTQVVQAEENQSIELEGEKPNPNNDPYTTSPLWDYTLISSQGLSISASGMATGTAHIVGYDNVKRISSYMFLQYYNTKDNCYEGVNGASWSQMVGDTINEMEHAYQLTKKGKYRIKMVHYVYSTDGNSETIISYSGEEIY